jgi:sugar/nucleoside kinase (ribokinase family)
VFNMPRMRRGGPALLERARAAGLETSVDTMWDTAGKWMEDFAAFCPFIDCLFVNHDEARMLAGSAEPAAVGKFFRSHGVGMTVLKMGERGCAVLAREEEFVVPACKVEAVDTTGAGDSFCGGFLAARGLGRSLREAARLGNAVAAQCIQKIGGTEGLDELGDGGAFDGVGCE